MIVSTLREIEAVLRPVIGQGGFDALYLRGLYLAGLVHPWLAPANQPAQGVDLGALRAVLAQQVGSEAAAAGAAVLQTLDDLLVSVIGRSLTDELLGSVDVHAVTKMGAVARDTLP